MVTSLVTGNGNRKRSMNPDLVPILAGMVPPRAGECFGPCPDSLLGEFVRESGGAMLFSCSGSLPTANAPLFLQDAHCETAPVLVSDANSVAEQSFFLKADLFIT